MGFSFIAQKIIHKNCIAKERGRVSGSCPIPEGAQGHVKWGLGQPDLVPDLMAGNPIHGRGLELDGL